MGNCCFVCKSIKASDSRKSAPVVINFAKSACTVQFYGCPSSPATHYIRFALLRKDLSVDFVPTDTPEALPVIQIGSQKISGSAEMILRLIDAKFPHPPLLLGKAEAEVWEATPRVVRMVVLQHRSVTWHLERMVRWAEDLVAREGRSVGNPEMGTARMEVKKFGKSYSELLEVMLEHAQMEERVVFPILEKADRGLCKGANAEHARHLPLMNGIKEDIKSLGVMDTKSPNYHEALRTLSTRLQSLTEYSKEHFKEEEGEVLPLIDAVELSKQEQVSVLEQCLDTMQETHSNLFSFFVEGLLPLEAMQYLDLILACKDEERAGSVISTIAQ